MTADDVAPMTSRAQMLAIAGSAGGILPAGSAAFAGSWLVAVGAAAAVALALVAALLQLKSPVAGLTLLLVAGVLVPMEIPLEGWRAQPLLSPRRVLCGCFMLGMFRRRGRIALDRSRVVIATLAFVAVAITAFVVGQYPWFPTAHAPMSRASSAAWACSCFPAGCSWSSAIRSPPHASCSGSPGCSWQPEPGGGDLAGADLRLRPWVRSRSAMPVPSGARSGRGSSRSASRQALFNRAFPAPTRVAVGGVAALCHGPGPARHVQLGVGLAAAACGRRRGPAVSDFHGARSRPVSWS